jgi:hypothetical protein
MKRLKTRLSQTLLLRGKAQERGPLSPPGGGVVALFWTASGPRSQRLASQNGCQILQLHPATLRAADGDHPRSE